MPILVNPYAFGGVAVTYSSLMLPSAPAGWWRMGDASGAVLDSSGNSRSATIVGTPTRAVTGLVDGDADLAMGYNGGLNYAEVADAAWMDSASLTVEGVVKPAAIGTYVMILGRDEFPASRVFQFSINPNGKVEFLWWDVATGTLHTLVSDTALIAGVKYHVAAVINTTDARIYVNGLLDCTPASAGSGVRAGSAKLGLGVCHAGSSGAPAFPFNGTVDELAYFTTAQTAAEILARARKANTTSTLVSPFGGVQWTTWFMADDIALADGASVTSWSNRGVGPAGAAVPGVSPVYRPNGIGGRPAVEFNGTSQYLQTNMPCSSTAESVFAVVQPTDFANYRTILGATVTGGRHWLFNITSGTQALNRQNATGRAVSVAGTTAAAHYVGYTDTSAGAITFYKDGVSQGGGTLLNPYVAGSSRIGEGSGFFFKGKVSTIMSVNRVLDSTELSALATDLSAYYSI